MKLMQLKAEATGMTLKGMFKPNRNQAQARKIPAYFSNFNNLFLAMHQHSTFLLFS
jgi:hypothetical protein